MKGPYKSYGYGILSLLLRVCAIPFALMAALFFFAFLEGEKTLVTILTCVMLSLGSGLAAMALVWWSGKVSQKGADKLAESILDALEDGQHVEFYLYLRPFATTGELANISWATSLLDFTSTLRSPHQDLENKVTKALKGQGFLLALGKPGEAVGAGRVSASEEEWKAKISFLSERAKGIICVPGYSSGTRWEIHLLRSNNYLHKTVFVMPPKPARLDMAAEWEKTRHQLELDGFHLPAYDQKGLLFSVDMDGTLGARRSLSLYSIGKLRKDILAMI